MYHQKRRIGIVKANSLFYSNFSISGGITTCVTCAGSQQCPKPDAANPRQVDTVGYAVVHISLVLSRDFHVSGSLLRCMTATMSKVSPLIW